MTAPATEPAPCTISLLGNDGRTRRTVESHHMVKRDGKWTCLHCGVQR